MPAAKLLALAGGALMLHAAASMIQFRSYLKVTPDADPSQPLDIVFECLLALGLLSLASAGLAGDLKQRFAAPDLAKKTVDELNQRRGFYRFNHRGQTLPRGDGGAGGKSSKRD